MKDFVKRMINEHKELLGRIDRLEQNVYIDNKDDKVEFANKCVQLKCMRGYADALACRLKNQGIELNAGQYFEKVADIHE